MECSLSALILCFSWSNFYVDTSVQVIDVKQVYVTHGEVRMEYLNPYGGLTLGFAVPFRNGQVSIEATHTSSLATTEDRGFNSVGIHARWFPFR